VIKLGERIISLGSEYIFSLSDIYRCKDQDVQDNFACFSREYETWSLKQMEGHRLKVSENRVVTN
jgi:hypothetical protein